MKIKKKQTIAQLEKELVRLEKKRSKGDKIVGLKNKIKELKYGRQVEAVKRVGKGLWDVTKGIGKGFMAVGDKLAAEQEEMAKKRAEQEKLEKKNKKKKKPEQDEYGLGEFWYGRK